MYVRLQIPHKRKKTLSSINFRCRISRSPADIWSRYAWLIMRSMFSSFTGMCFSRRRDRSKLFFKRNSAFLKRRLMPIACKMGQPSIKNKSQTLCVFNENELGVLHIIFLFCLKSCVRFKVFHMLIN